MRETRADTIVAVSLALLLHALPVLLLLLASLWWRGPASSAAGEPITADVIDPNALTASMRNALRREPLPLQQPVAAPLPAPVGEAIESEPTPEPLPEPLPEDVSEPQQLQAQEQLPEPDDVQQEEVRADAVSPEVRQREQEAKQRQGQVDLTERQRQEEAEQRRLSAMERERLRQLEDIKRQREQNRRMAELSRERLQQIADREARTASANAAQADTDASASAPPGNRGTDHNLKAQWLGEMLSKVQQNWVRSSPSIRPGVKCPVRVRIARGGEVIEAVAMPSCPYDEQGRSSIEAAVLKASPLPYYGYESVYDPVFVLNAQPPQ